MPDYKDSKCQKIHLSYTYNKFEVSIFNTVTFRRYPATVPYLIFYSIWYLIPASSDPQIGAYCLQQLTFHTHCPLFYRAIPMHTLNLPDDFELPALLLSFFSSVSNSRNAEEDSNVIQYNGEMGGLDARGGVMGL